MVRNQYEIMTDEFTVRDALEVSYITEEKAKAFYEKIMKRFGQSTIIFELMKSLRDDEQIHSDVIRELMDTIPSSIQDAPCSPELNSALRSLESIDIDSYNPSTVLDAIEMAHELEASEINVLYKLMIQEYIDSDVRKKMIISEITKHQNKLTEFRMNYHHISHELNQRELE